MQLSNTRRNAPQFASRALQLGRETARKALKEAGLFRHGRSNLYGLSVLVQKGGPRAGQSTGKKATDCFERSLTFRLAPGPHQGLLSKEQSDAVYAIVQSASKLKKEAHALVQRMTAQRKHGPKQLLADIEPIRLGIGRRMNDARKAIQASLKPKG
ncbi:MAG: hypothetical protein K2X01_00265 [Cyanobacteria bacterium]|nr:hypothetical protein [Cyanobacteriota bacterium]